jgi:hypothetical protein
MANRLVRDGWRTAQTSNAYLLVPAGAGTLPTIPAPRCGGQSGRETLQVDISAVQQVVLEVSERERMGAGAALARVAAQRQAVIQARLLNRGSGSAVRAI